MGDFSLKMAIKGDLRKIFDDEKTLTRNACAAAVKAQTAETKPDVRGVTAPVLGAGVANAWRDRFYRNKGDASPAGFIYTKAPALIKAFSADTVILPKRGRFLAIPTNYNRPKGRRSGAQPRVTVEDMARSNMDFVRPRKNGPGFLWLLQVTEAQTRSEASQRIRKLAFAGGMVRVGGGRGRPTRGILKVGAVPMFVLVPDVRLKKRIDLDGVMSRARDRFPDKLSSAYAMLDQGYRP